MNAKQFLCCPLRACRANTIVLSVAIHERIKVTLFALPFKTDLWTEGRIKRAPDEFARTHHAGR